MLHNAHYIKHYGRVGLQLFDHHVTDNYGLPQPYIYMNCKSASIRAYPPNSICMLLVNEHAANYFVKKHKAVRLIIVSLQINNVVSGLIIADQTEKQKSFSVIC